MAIVKELHVANSKPAYTLVAEVMAVNPFHICLFICLVSIIYPWCGGRCKVVWYNAYFFYKLYIITIQINLQHRHLLFHSCSQHRACYHQWPWSFSRNPSSLNSCTLRWLKWGRRLASNLGDNLQILLDLQFILHYTHGNTLQRNVYQVCEVLFRVIALGQHISFWRNVAAVAMRRWQYCIWFDRLEVWTSDLPLQRRRVTAWSIDGTSTKQFCWFCTKHIYSVLRRCFDWLLYNAYSCHLFIYFIF